MIKKSSKNFLYEDLSYKTVGCFYDVYNELGPAHKEQIYHQSLAILFKDQNIRFASKQRLPIHFKGQKVGTYEPDFVIEDKIIVELKSVLNMPKVFENQLYYYLRGSKYRLGYIVNFGNEHIDIRRRIFDTAKFDATTKIRDNSR